MPAFVNALNKVDLPTLGNPTIPHFKLMAVPQNQARKCMPCARGAWALLRAAVTGLLICGGLAATAAHADDAQGALLLGDKRPALNAQRLGGAWVDATGGTSFEQVLAGAARFQPPSPDMVYTLGAQGALWLHYRLTLEPKA